MTTPQIHYDVTFLLANEPIPVIKKYEPYCLFAERLFVESIVFDGFNPAMTLLVQFKEKNGISSQKHIFCQPDQLGHLLMGNDEDAERILSRLVGLLSSDHIEYPEVLDVEALLGHPLTISDWRLQLYHPITKNCVTGADEIDFDLFCLDHPT